MVWIDHVFFVPSSVDGHLGRFRLLAGMSSAAVYMCVHTFVRLFYFHLSWVYILEFSFLNFIFCPWLPGGNVILACRDMEKCEAAAKEIRGETLNHRVNARHLDLASLRSVREFATKILAGRREDAGVVRGGLGWPGFEEQIKPGRSSSGVLADCGPRAGLVTPCSCTARGEDFTFL